MIQIEVIHAATSQREVIGEPIPNTESNLRILNRAIELFELEFIPGVSARLVRINRLQLLVSPTPVET